jgi:hypothetical protein
MLSKSSTVAGRMDTIFVDGMSERSWTNQHELKIPSIQKMNVPRLKELLITQYRRQVDIANLVTEALPIYGAFLSHHRSHLGSDGSVVSFFCSEFNVVYLSVF